MGEIRDGYNILGIQTEVFDIELLAIDKAFNNLTTLNIDYKDSKVSICIDS
jgi:hypothetical protein